VDCARALPVTLHSCLCQRLPYVWGSDLPRPQISSEVYNATVASEGVLLLASGHCFMPLGSQALAAAHPQVCRVQAQRYQSRILCNSDSCNQPSISSLNCDFVQRHPDGSFTSSSRSPCPLRHLTAAVLLLQPSSHAYFHFMFETLPRLQLALPWMRRHTNCSILVDAWHGNSWSLQALDLLGFAGAVVVRQAHVRYSVAIGFIPPAPPIHHTFPAELNATVQQLLLAADAAAGGIDGDGSVLFIQRSSSESQHSAIHSGDCLNGVRMREILNMKAVETALRSRFGSRLVVFRSHGLHLTQQIKAFRRARLVIGVHGSFAMRVLLLPRCTHTARRGRSREHNVLRARNSCHRDPPAGA
jgi:hypothetical protein